MNQLLSFFCENAVIIAIYVRVLFILRHITIAIKVYYVSTGNLQEVTDNKYFDIIYLIININIKKIGGHQNSDG